ncbi:MAG: hypothetical protein QM723_32250 [Myxococcaceae bacterium]
MFELGERLRARREETFEPFTRIERHGQSNQPLQRHLTGALEVFQGCRCDSCPARELLTRPSALQAKRPHSLCQLLAKRSGLLD